MVALESTGLSDVNGSGTMTFARNLPLHISTENIGKNCQNQTSQSLGNQPNLRIIQEKS